LQSIAKSAKVSKAAVEMASNFNLGVDEYNTEELLEVDLTKEELLELDQKRIAEEEAREKETAGEEELLRKFTVMGLAEAFLDLKKLFKIFKICTPTTKGFQ